MRSSEDFGFGRTPGTVTSGCRHKAIKQFSEPETRRTELATTIESVITRPLTDRPAWKELQNHSKKIRRQHLRTLFAADPERGQRMTAEAASIYLDYSKNRI